MKTLTVSEAKPRLGALLDQVTKGKELLLRRKKRLYRIEEVAEVAPIPTRAVGFFRFDDRDELTDLADRATPSFDAG
jgi:antitoxin (DNA-binding transcriptional repressor) of toxin-antitoxin stability system